MSQPATVVKILDAAEQLFAEHGFAETSLRSITSKAGVNLAAVNYHFGSKKALIQAVFARFLDPFIAHLGSRLDQMEQDGGQPDLEEVLEMLVDQILSVEPRRPNDLPTFMRLMGTAFSQNQGHLKRFITENYGFTFSRYYSFLLKTCPDLPAADMFWRTYFILGAAVFSMSGAEALLAIGRRDHNIDDDIESVMRRMVPFVAAGLRAHT